MSLEIEEVSATVESESSPTSSDSSDRAETKSVDVPSILAFQKQQRIREARLAAN